MRKVGLAIAFLALAGGAAFAPAFAQTVDTGLSRNALLHSGKIDLARRLLAVNEFGSFADKIERSILQNATGVPVLSQEPDLYRAAMNRAVAAHTADLNRIEEERVNIYAAIYTGEELRALLSYPESADGQAALKKLAAHEPLSAEEASMHRAYLDGPVLDAAAHTKQAEAQILLTSYSLENLIYTETVLNYCNSGAPCDKEFRAAWEEEEGKAVGAFGPYRGPRATAKYALALRVIKAEGYSIAHFTQYMRSVLDPFMFPNRAAREAALDRVIIKFRPEAEKIQDELAQRYVMAFDQKDLQVFATYLESPEARAFFTKVTAYSFEFIRRGPDARSPPNLTPTEEAARNAYSAYRMKLPMGSSSLNENNAAVTSLAARMISAVTKEYCDIRPDCHQEMVDAIGKAFGPKK